MEGSIFFIVFGDVDEVFFFFRIDNLVEVCIVVVIEILLSEYLNLFSI